MATMRDVARVAGVSAKTVSRVFNDDPQVAPATAARVQAALRELNYVPNALATTFRAGRSPVIGVAVPDIADPFFSFVAKGAETLAVEHGLTVVISSLGQDPAREQPIVESLLRQSPSGLLVAPVADDHAYLESWADRVPLVFVDRPPVGLEADTFLEDDHDGAFRATEHLLGHGHRRIAFLGDDASVPTTRARLAGYRAALVRAGVEPDDRVVEVEARGREGAGAALTRLGSLADPPTAVFSSNARTTMSAVPLLADRDLAVVAFGDFPLADSLTPALTVVDQDPYELGTRAVQRILDRLSAPGSSFSRHTVLPVELVVRASCSRGSAPAGAGAAPGGAEGCTVTAGRCQPVSHAG